LSWSLPTGHGKSEPITIIEIRANPNIDSEMSNRTARPVLPVTGDT
jgi:hypothetical protein